MNRKIVAANLRKLERTFGKYKNNLAIVITQPDPDALGTAFGLRLIAWQLHQVELPIYMAGSMSHPQNKVLATLYDLHAKIKPIGELPIDGSMAAFLADSSVRNDSRFTTPEQVEIVGAVDHHLGCDLDEAEDSSVIIEHVGAASTLVVEMIQMMLRNLTVSYPKEYAWVATILSLGIYTDTESLTNKTQRDVDAYSYITKQALSRDLDDLFNYTLPDRFYELQQKALERRDKRGSTLVTDIGYIAPSEGDYLAILADQFIRNDSTLVVVVWAVIEKSGQQFVRMSARSKGVDRDLHRMLSTSFPGSGAKFTEAKKGLGGGQIAIEFGFWDADSVAVRTAKLAFIRACMANSIFE